MACYRDSFPFFLLLLVMFYFLLPNKQFCPNPCDDAHFRYIHAVTHFTARLDKPQQAARGNTVS
jgi:hypothetical protein